MSNLLLICKSPALIHRQKTWGLGGCCVNVGCIPKILMHISAGVSESLREAKNYGFNVEKVQFRWETLVGAVQRYIQDLNFNYV